MNGDVHGVVMVSPVENELLDPCRCEQRARLVIGGVSHLILHV